MDGVILSQQDYDKMQQRIAKLEAKNEKLKLSNDEWTRDNWLLSEQSTKLSAENAKQAAEIARLRIQCGKNEMIEGDYATLLSLEAKNEKQCELLSEIAQSGVEFQDERLRYVVVQIDATDWETLQQYKGGE